MSKTMLSSSHHTSYDSESLRIESAEPLVKTRAAVVVQYVMLFGVLVGLVYVRMPQIMTGFWLQPAVQGSRLANSLRPEVHRLGSSRANAVDRGLEASMSPPKTGAPAALLFLVFDSCCEIAADGRLSSSCQAKVCRLWAFLICRLCKDKKNKSDPPLKQHCGTATSASCATCYRSS